MIAACLIPSVCLRTQQHRTAYYHCRGLAVNIRSSSPFLPRLPLSLRQEGVEEHGGQMGGHEEESHGGTPQVLVLRACLRSCAQDLLAGYYPPANDRSSKLAQSQVRPDSGGPDDHNRRIFMPGTSPELLASKLATNWRPNHILLRIFILHPGLKLVASETAAVVDELEGCAARDAVLRCVLCIYVRTCRPRGSLRAIAQGGNNRTGHPPCPIRHSQKPRVRV